MLLFPAIDLKEGRCVRLVRGDMTQATVFNDDPAAQARIFFEQGFTHLHVVDLDGAFSGRSMNGDAVSAILAAVPGMTVQLGGGLRNLASVEGWLSKGISRAILGTAAVRDPAFVKEAAQTYPGQVLVGVDAHDGRVAVEGWAQTSHLSVLDLVERFADVGVGAVIYTDIARDGVLLGVNWEATKLLADRSPIPVIASGGLASLADIETMIKLAHPNIEGVISGRALYDGRIDPIEALALLARSPNPTRKEAVSC